MEKKFTSDDLKLAELLSAVGNGVLQLPDFQRGWVWDDDHIRSLLASISLFYPIGAVMTLQTGNTDVRFRPRLLEGVECGHPNPEPEFLLLDGQQRITSLFLALKSPNPVPTRDARGVAVNRHYYADINKSISEDADREEDAIVSVPADRVVRSDFGRVIDTVLTTRGGEIKAEMFPLEIVLDAGATMDYQMAYCRESRERIEKWKRFQEEIIAPFIAYEIPTIKLTKSTPKEAVCQVFEKVNTGGVTLTVFELLTATFAADDFNLRDDWKKRSQDLREYKLLERFQSTGFLQIVTLLSTYDRRRKYVSENPQGESLPALSCKRRDVLRLSLSDYQEWADTAVAGLKRAVSFLHQERLFRADNLPYTTQLIPLSAILGVLGDKSDGFTSRERLKQWFWCGALGEMYGHSAETQFAYDIQDCVAWIEDGGRQPRTVRAAQFQADRLLTLRTRQSAAYKGVHALELQRGSRDIRTGVPIDGDAYFDLSVDIHHVFPVGWCSKNGVDRGHANCVVNKTAVGAHTKRAMSGNPPSVYLRGLQDREHIDDQQMDGFLRSHDIDPPAVRQDDFGKFFNRRFEALIDRIGQAMGKPVNRTANRDESPFLERDEGHDLDREIRELITSGETDTIEFKSTGRKNVRTGEKDAAIEWSLVKSICAFMNTNGGTLLVGVNDGGEPVGIEQDFPFVKSNNRDGWTLWMTDLVSKTMGPVAVTDLRIRCHEIDGKTIARVDVNPAARRVFCKTVKGPKRDVFYVRFAASTEELTGQDLVDYLEKKQWAVV